MMDVRRILLIAVLLAAWTLPADDAESSRLATEAADLARAREWRDAAKMLEEAEFTAETPLLKLNSLLGQAEAWRRCGLLFREYEVIEKILKHYPTRCDFNYWVKREYEIAQAFVTGYRDPAFWYLRFIPWLTDEDRTETVAENVLKHAPFAAAAPELRLRLAFYYDEKGKIDKAIRHLRAIIKDYPEASQQKYALLALGEMLYFLSRKGDGDGRLNREALEVFEDFRKHYPGASEMPYVDKCILEGKDIQSERMLGIAQFYNRTGRKQAAQQYLNRVLKEYPDSLSAAESERLLVKLDKEYTPDEFPPEIKPRLLSSPRRAIPDEGQILLIAPENSNGRYLLPIYDLKSPQQEKDKK